jgi:RNA polymerase sigma-70 factor (ECF subfamily)
MSQSSLDRLVGQAREGDRDAWGEVYRELGPVVLRLCRRILPTHEDAEDAAAEIFMKAQLKLEHYDPGRPFKPWLYRVAANHCWDVLRARRGRQVVDDGEVDVESRDPDPLERMLARETHEEVRGALSRLDDRARLALSLRYFAELSYDEISDVLGVTSSFVGVLLLRARRRLRRILTEQEER